MQRFVHHVMRESRERVAVSSGTVLAVLLQRFQWWATGRRRGQHDSSILEGPDQCATTKDTICKQCTPTVVEKLLVGD